MTTMSSFLMNTPLASLATGVLCLSLSGCDTAPTAVDQHFGQAVRSSHGLTPVAQQAVAPMAGPHETDGVTAKAAVDRYHESLQAPVTPTGVFNFNLGATPAR